MRGISNRSFYKIALLLLVSLVTANTAQSQAYRLPDKKQKKETVQQQKQPAQTVDTAMHASTDPKPEPEIRNIKVLSEVDDGKGNTVRTIQYSKGSMRITETVIKPRTATVGSVYVKIDPDTMDKKQVVLVVDKTKYMVKVLYKKRAIRAYKATFGPLPKQNKCMEGDRCTPEGTFTITNLNPKSMYNKFMLISYPDETSKTRFNELKKAGKIPASAKIGGAIGIHGIWKGGDQLIDLGVGWTDGCVALKNRDVDELFTMVGIGTKVMITQ